MPHTQCTSVKGCVRVCVCAWPACICLNARVRTCIQKGDNNNTQCDCRMHSSRIQNPKHTHIHRDWHTHTCSHACGLVHTYPFTVVRVVKRVQVGKNKTFSQLIALNLKCCKINSRVMPNTQAQSFMQTETANVERDGDRDRKRE